LLEKIIHRQDHELFVEHLKEEHVEVIANASTLLANPKKNQMNRFSTNLEKSLPRIRGTSQKPEQVFINLMQNALESLESKDKTVSVGSGFDTANHLIFIEVRDEGCGMEDKILRRVLDPFYATKRSKGGTGLGLAIAARTTMLAAPVKPSSLAMSAAGT
jgi:C4-dicarboxylate-specific signal transduction histidine kinase